MKTLTIEEIDRMENDFRTFDLCDEDTLELLAAARRSVEMEAVQSPVKQEAQKLFEELLAKKEAWMDGCAKEDVEAFKTLPDEELVTHMKDLRLHLPAACHGLQNAGVDRLMLARKEAAKLLKQLEESEAERLEWVTRATRYMDNKKEAQAEAAKWREVAEVAFRLFRPRYLPWSDAGGPENCPHGYTKGIPCPSCDEEFMKKVLTQFNAAKQ